MNKMPSKGGYLALVIFGFILGIVWGVLSLGPYRNLKAAVDADDYYTAQENAKKIKRYILIGIVVNILIAIVRTRMG